MIKFSRSTESGRTMIEAIGYISVMIMITVAASALVNSGFYKYRQGRINQELTDLKKVVSQRYVAAEDYKDVKMADLCNDKIGPYKVVPAKKSSGGCESANGRHAFGGAVKIGSGDSKGTTFFIEFDDLPRAECVELGLRIWVVNDGSDLDAMKINGKTWAWEYSNSIKDPNYKLPAQAADITQACTKEYDNIIIWYFN